MLPAVTMQLPIVFFLMVVSFQAEKAFKEKSFSWIGGGWLLNFLAICMRQYFPSYRIMLGASVTIAPREILVSLGSALFFIGARRLQGLEHRCLARSVPEGGVLLAGLTVASVYSSLSAIFRPAEVLQNVLAVTPVVLFDMLAIFSASVFFKGFYQLNLSRERSGFRFLYYSTILYLLIQPIKIFLKAFPSAAHGIESAGFSLGLVAKIGISFGMVGLLASATAKAREERTRLQAGRRTIERIAHELGTPISEMILHVQELQSEAGKRGRFIGLAADLENALFRVRAIMHAAKLDLPLDAPIVSPGMPQRALGIDPPVIVSANTLLQSAVMAVKATRDERVIFHHSYAANCCLLCRPTEVIQVLINILRNSIDAFPRGEGEVFISTRTERLSRDAESDGFDQRYVYITVRDNGEGIREELREQVFREGFTTRGGAGRGFGLAVVRDLVEQNGGSIKLEKAGTVGSENASGTMVTLRFQWVACTGDA